MGNKPGAAASPIVTPTPDVTPVDTQAPIMVGNPVPDVTAPVVDGASEEQVTPIVAIPTKIEAVGETSPLAEALEKSSKEMGGLNEAPMVMGGLAAKMAGLKAKMAADASVKGTTEAPKVLNIGAGESFTFGDDPSPAPVKLGKTINVGAGESMSFGFDTPKVGKTINVAPG